ncbi:MAG TPA: monofunctional biosynthetic peptidoglycan transglycosylase, partial [Desulfatiglandales bacterium]|nr:monofunctional biosynthetic peptidoglycan transglycosylase [Desulfatiglandales bacterium]
GIRNYIKRAFIYCLKLFLKLACVFILLTVAQVAILRYVNPPFTAEIVWIKIKNRISEKQDIVPQYYWRPLKDISPSLIKAVLAGEDQRFMFHHGFDLTEINKAVSDIYTGKRIRGASTITMQVARSIFLWRGRSLLRKGLEAYYTLLIEIFLTKMRILELYLNVVDWGTGIAGAEAASQKYFNRSAADIDPGQAAAMAAILPNPHKWSPNSPSRYVRERRDKIIQDMEKMHL